MRAGRMTAGQEQGWLQGFPQFGLTVAQGALDWDRTFGSPGRRVLEIGFGMGDSLLQMAQAEPEAQFVGIEVHRPGVGRLLSQCMAHASLDAVHIFFPDPWHKKRHHKRRLIQSKFVGDLAHVIREGGYLHLATDWAPYAKHMFDVLDAEPRFTNAGGAARTAVARPDYRPVTKFEFRGERLGHAVQDLIYLRASS